MQNKTKKPSKTALTKALREARKAIKEQKELIERQRESLNEYEREIKRRDNATAHFRRLEPRALAFAYAYLKEWRRLGRPTLDRALRGEANSAAIEAAKKATGEGFWQCVYIDLANDYLLIMDSAENPSGEGLDDYGKGRKERIFEP